MHQNNALLHATYCQYSAVKNNFKRLPAITKLWNFTLAADLNGDASRFKCQLVAFYF